MTRRDWTVAGFFHYHSRLDQWRGAEPSRQPVGRMPPPASPVEIETIERGNLAGGEIAASLLDPLLEARLVVPRQHVGTLRRTRLLRQLRSAGDRPVVLMVAPPGYGKSSLLVQWATEGVGPVAWLTAHDTDNDPVVFLTDLAAAIDRRAPLGADLFSAIAADTLSHRSVIGRLLAGMSRPRSRSGSQSTTRTGSPHGRVSTSLRNWSNTCPKGRRWPSRGARGCASRSPAGVPRVRCARSVRPSWRWTSVRPSGWHANSGYGCPPRLRRA